MKVVFAPHSDISSSPGTHTLLRDASQQRGDQEETTESGRDPGIVLLSFFQGLGTACLICDEYCQGKGLSWRGASWEIDANLAKVISNHQPRGDFENETADSVHDLVKQLDPSGQAVVVVAAGPPCHDFSRIRADAPGHLGPEGSKFARFAQLVVDLEKVWSHGRAVLIVENMVPQDRAAMRKIAKILDIYKVDTGGLALPRCLAEEGKPLPCLTTPRRRPAGTPRTEELQREDQQRGEPAMESRSPPSVKEHGIIYLLSGQPNYLSTNGTKRPPTAGMRVQHA